MRSTISISKRSDGYLATVTGKFGGGYMGCPAGTTPHEASLHAINAMIAYAMSNSEGGDLVAPPEVMALVPKRLHSVADRSKEEQDGNS